MGRDAVAQDNDGPADNAAPRLIRPTVLAAALSDTQKKDTDAQAVAWMEQVRKILQ